MPLQAPSTGDSRPASRIAAPTLGVVRVMHVTPSLTVAGMERVIQAICGAIDRERFAPSILCLRERGELAPELEAVGVPVFSLHERYERPDRLAFVKVARLLRRERIDVLHTHNTQALLDGTLGAILGGVRTVIHTDHARNFPDKLRYMAAEHVAAYYAHRVVGVSSHSTENLRRYLRIPRRKLVTVINGIDVGRYHRAVDARAKRRELGLPAEGRLLGVAARITEQKGLTYLLQALPNVLARHPDVSLMIAGQGSEEAQLRAEIAARGLERHVHFVGVRLDVPDILHILDAFVLPSLWEGLPMVLLEALASGCPIVATSVGGVPDAVRHEETGLLVPPRDPAALAHAIDRMLGDHALRARATDNGLHLVRERFSSDAMTRQYERLYRRESPA
jgi:glycosyltransferase involved in cell wall biosynthesis